MKNNENQPAKPLSGGSSTSLQAKEPSLIDLKVNPI